jgi:hypothetical protein
VAYTGFWVGNLRERDHLEYPGVDRRIILSLQEVGCGGQGLDRADLGYGQLACTCECGNEPSGSIKCGEFLY